MSKIKVEKPTKEKLQELGVLAWPIWTKEVSTFDWFYDEPETCYILDGDVVVEEEDGNKVEFGAGDLVVFNEGLKCIWDIKSPVRKHYNFG